MPLRKLVESANYAIEGLLHAAKTQRHVRYHFYAAIIILLLGLVLGITRFEFIAVIVIATLVLSVELLNTAIEETVNILFKEYDRRAKIIKDIAAGAVLTLALGASVIGYIVFLPYLREVFDDGLLIAKHAGDDIAIISIVVVLILVIITKTYFGRGLPLKGGMPSGHAAVAFSVWVAVTFLSEAFVPSFLILILAILIAQSRVSVGIHRPWEVVLGALLGSVATFLLFKMFI
jgi:diacylglycerol kinase (ATP)